MSIPKPPPLVLPAAVIRELDRRTIADCGLAGIVLMENAGLRAADLAREMMFERRLDRAVVLAGKGNNGGDGFVVARHLVNSGVEVEVLSLFPDEEIRAIPDAWSNLLAARAARVPILAAAALDPEDPAIGFRREGTLIVDALLGTGFRAPLREPYRRWIGALRRCDRPVLAIDLPSGLDPDTGAEQDLAVRADRTVTFVALKPGFRTGKGPELCGEVTVVDISIPAWLIAEALRDERTRSDGEGR